MSTKEPIADDYELMPAYPNPFNPVTSLSFSVPEKQNVLFQIVDLQGKVIETLINDNREAGYHSIVWDANANASGVYFAKIVAGNYTNIQKLVLIK